MKKKFSKILGVALTLVMVLTLAAAFSLPVGASPGENEWSTFTYPDEGSDGDWFRQGAAADTEVIAGGPGPIAKAIDDTLYAYVWLDDGDGNLEADEANLMKSEDGGRTWDVTDYADDLDDEGAIVAIACSSLDAEILYVADANYVYKSDDAGDSFDTVADASLTWFLTYYDEVITCLDVGYDADDSPYVFVGSASIRGDTGGVYYIIEEAYGAAWEDLGAGYYAFFGIGCSPDFANDSLTVAVGTDGTNTYVCSNYGIVADWDEVELLNDAVTPVAFPITEASDPAFPTDFEADDAWEFFVGVVGEAHTAADEYGGVYRLYDEDYSDLLDDVDADIISLDLVGDVGTTLLLAGVYDAGVVWYSTDDGDEWDEPDKNPSGDGPTYVVMADDFADTETAWAATSGFEAAVSLTVDGGVLYNQISLIATGIDSVDSVSFSREYKTDETMFMVTSFGRTDSLLRYDGDNWERVFVSTIFDDIDMVQLSPDFLSDNTLFVGDRDTGAIFRSTDGGQDFSELRVPPDEFTSWIVIDDETIITGGDGVVYKTTNHGRRAWDDYDVDGRIIISFALSPDFAHDDTIILGDDDGQIFISEDAGEEWDLVEEAIVTTGETYVAFDPDYAVSGADGENTIYAAAGDEVNRCVIDTAEDWEDQEWDEFTTSDTELSIEAASGLLVSADGTLYAADSTSADADDGGVWRSLNPTDDLDDVVFELVGVDFELDTGVTLYSFKLTAGSNVLWAIDEDTVDLWTYEDTLATEVVVTSPADGKVLDDTDEVTFEWEELTGADEYTLKYTDDPDWIENVETETGIEDTVITIDGLDDGTTYYWKVKVSQGEPLLSRYSDEERSFTTALEEVEVPVHWLPENGAQDVIITPSFGWTAVSGATSYEFELADNPEFTGATKITPTINSCLSPKTLDYSTTYYWKVRGLKDTKVVSEWVSGAFTTMAEPVEPLPPVEITPAPPAPVLPAPITPGFIWAIIIIGAVLVIAVIVLIVRTRRVV